MEKETLISPYPADKIEGQYGGLERYLLTIDRQGLPDYKKLPPSLTALGAEQYANWIGKLTQNDAPYLRERGAYVHIHRKEPQRIIYPTNPNIGTGKGCTPIRSQKPELYLPVLCIHSHYHPCCFTNYPGDLSSFIQKSLPLVDLLVTPEFNYLLLKTKETPTIDGEEAFDQLAQVDPVYRAYQDNRHNRAPYPSSKRFPLSIFHQYHHQHLISYEEDLKHFGVWGLDTYLINLWTSLTFAKLYRIGFYFSHKDGSYCRVDEGWIKKLIQNKLKNL